MQKVLLHIAILVSVFGACKTDKSVYKPKKRKKGKCDCPHMKSELHILKDNIAFQDATNSSRITKF
jgi:hypothetical protein